MHDPRSTPLQEKMWNVNLQYTYTYIYIIFYNLFIGE